MSEENVTRQLAAILYADVSGYSRLTQADEIGTHRQLSAGLDLIADRVRSSNGEVVHYAGDAILARFQSVVAATNCAVGVQSTIGALCADLPPDQRLLFRIGINLGEVIVDRDDIYGDGVNVAARLESLADPGGICISESVFLQVRDKLDAGFEDIGEQKLKNIEPPMRAYRIAPGPIDDDQAMDKRLRASSFAKITGPGTKDELNDVFVPSEPPSIMILPFRNLSGDPEQDALVDGFRLTIQSSLVKLPGLFLINAPAVEHYRNSDVSAIQAGNETGVRYVIDGAVQMSGDRVRVTVQLTDAPAAQIVWAERYDRIIDDIFEIQDEITTEVVVSLDVKLLTGEENLVWWNMVSGRKARELLLRGMSNLYMGSKEGNNIARGIFEELSQILPDSAQIMALLAFTNWLAVFRGWSSDPAESIERAISQAETAIELGDPDGFGHVVMASVSLSQRRHDDALAFSKKATSIRLSCPLAIATHSNVLHFDGQHEQAIRNIKAAVKHARIYPPWMANVLSAAYRDSGQIAPSITVANECLRLDAEDLDGHVLLCTDYSLSDSLEDARSVAQEILSIEPSFSIAAYLEKQPYKDRGKLDGIAGALREAGLPD